MFQLLISLSKFRVTSQTSRSDKSILAQQLSIEEVKVHQSPEGQDMSTWSVVTTISDISGVAEVGHVPLSGVTTKVRGVIT